MTVICISLTILGVVMIVAPLVFVWKVDKS